MFANYSDPFQECMLPPSPPPFPPLNTLSSCTCMLVVSVGRRGNFVLISNVMNAGFKLLLEMVDGLAGAAIFVQILPCLYTWEVLHFAQSQA